MKKHYIILAACLAIASCAKESAELDSAPEYYTFKAFIEDNATKVEFGDKDASTKYLQWKDGDVVRYRLIVDNGAGGTTAVYRSGTINVDGESATVTVDLKNAHDGINSIEKIWYPYLGVDSEPAEIPTEQSYDKPAIPVHMTAINSTTVTLSTYLDYAVLEFPVTQTSCILPTESSRATYLPKSTTLSSIRVNVEGGEDYNLSTSSDSAVDLKTLSDEADGDKRVQVNKSYYVVIPPVTEKKLTVTYTTEDDISFSNSKNSLSLATKSYRKMPSLDLTGYHFWRFGTSYSNNDCNGMVYWMRDIKGDGTRMTLSNGTDAETNTEFQYLNVSAGLKYMTIYPFKASSGDVPYIYDFGPLWNNGHFCSDGVNQLTFNSSEKKGKMTLSAEYPIFAIAIDRPKALANFSTNIFNFDPSGSGGFDNRTIYNEQGTEVTDQNHVGKTLIYSKMAETDKVLFDKEIADVERVKVKLRVAFTSNPSSVSDVPLNVYWAGTFRTEADAKAFFRDYTFE